MPFTSYADRQLVLQLFSGTALLPPNPWYVGLSTTTPTQASTSNWNFTEPVGNAYERVSVANDPTHWGVVLNPPTNGYAVNNNELITFPQASGSWGTITNAGLWDAISGGNLWGFCQLLNPLNVVSASIVYFLPSTLVILNN